MGDSNYNFFDTIDDKGTKVQGYGLGSIQTATNVFGAWNAYQSMLAQRKNSRFNQKIAMANYSNQAKSSNMALDKYTRYKRMLEGKTTNETDQYMSSQAYQNRKFKEAL